MRGGELRERETGGGKGVHDCIYFKGCGHNII